MHLFFDGTQNNIYNVRLRERIEVRPYPFSNEMIDRVTESDSSYQNDRSNVARLWEAAPTQRLTGDDLQYSLYVEGMGTEGSEADSSIGKGLGMGSTGIPARVSWAFRESASIIASNCPERDRPLEVRLTVFGFSRGAAAARHFVYKALRGGEPTYLTPVVAVPLVYDRYLRTVWRFDSVTVRVEFAGLFDTVASFGVMHRNDVWELSLDEVALAERSVHLVAADEYRENFALSNISNSVLQKRAVEIYLPGAHSDVGGGYLATSEENDDYLLLPTSPSVTACLMSPFSFGLASAVEQQQTEWRRRLESDRLWLVEKGWCETGEATVAPPRLTVRRTGIKHHYALIPLQIMRDFAVDHRIIFKNSLNEYVIDKELADLRTHTGERVDAYLKAYARKPGSKLADWHQSPTPNWLKTLRHRYFHMSAQYSTISLGMHVFQPQFSIGGSDYGTGWNHLMRGTRHRRVFGG